MEAPPKPPNPSAANSGGRSRSGSGRDGRGGRDSRSAGRPGGGRGGRADGKPGSNPTKNIPAKAGPANDAGRARGDRGGGGGPGRGRSQPLGGRTPASGARGSGGGKPGSKELSVSAKTTVPPKPTAEEERLRREREMQEAQAAEEKRVAAAAAMEAQRLQKQKSAIATQLRESRELLQSTLQACRRRAAHRAALQPEALAAARAQFETTKKTLKTDLKKCTALVKKLKSSAVWGAGGAELAREVAGLNLTRYVEEVVANIVESQPKASDIDALVTVCVALHERYPEFLPALLQALREGVLSTGNVKTRRLNFRILTDFYLVGLLADAKLLVRLVTEASGAKDTGTSGSDDEFEYAVQDGGLLVAFAKSAGFEIFGCLPTSVREAMEWIQAMHARVESAAEQPEEEAALLPPKEQLDEALTLIPQLKAATAERQMDVEICSILTKHTTGAFHFMSSLLVQTHNKLLKLEKRCEQDRILSGALSEAREKGLLDARKLKENLEKSVEALAEVLDQSMPRLQEDDDLAKEAGGGLEVWTRAGDGNDDFGPFDDEETRAFYFDVPDLLTTVPPALLGMTPEQVEKRKEENKLRYGTEVAQDLGDEGSSEVTQLTEAELDATEGASNSAADDGDTPTGATEEENKDTPHYRLMMLLEHELPECHQRAQLDEITERFCTNHGSSKNARKRLSRTLFLVPRNRLDLLPYFARMTATIDRIWGDVAETLVKELEQQFHGQTKFKKNQNIESRFKTARYIGELTKFSVAPPIIFLRCVRRCLDDFTGTNVDVLCCLLESCGRFIYRLNPQACSRLSSLMEITTRLSKAKNLDDRSQSLIKAALYSVNPPPVGARKTAKEYPPLETYLRHLLLVELDPSEKSVAFTAKQLVRLPWSDPSYDCGSLVAKLMLKACRKGRYRTIHAIAAVAERLRTQKWAGEINMRLVDLVFEELQWGLEHPDFRDQQRVLTYARLLAELYCCNQVPSNVILQQLYDFINIGHEIPEALREASKTLAIQRNDETSPDGIQLPVYNSATGVSQTIQEDEELDDTEVAHTPEVVVEPPKPLAVSEHSKYDPRVPTLTDPANSAYRIKLVCTLLDGSSKLLVTKNNLPKLKGFLAAFQRYLFIKTTLPVEVEFALLDTFDEIDSQWRKLTKGGLLKEDGFPRYASWLDAHNATVALEESGQLENLGQADLMESTKAGESVVDESIDEDDSSSQPEEEDDESLESDDDGGSEKLEADLISEGGGTAEHTAPSADENSQFSDNDSDEDDEEFNEEEYMRQLEEDAFERELRKVTMDALEKGKSLSRKQVAEYMPSGSQISMMKKKMSAQFDGGTSAAPPIPSTVNALGGKMGVNVQLLKKGAKGKVEVKALVVPADTALAHAATRRDDAALRERDAIKERVLRYEAESASAEYSGGNVYLEQEKLVRIRNRLSMEEIDKNFGTTGGNLRQNPSDTSRPTVSSSSRAPQPGRLGGAGRSAGPGRSSGRFGGRSSTSGRTLFG